MSESTIAKSCSRWRSACCPSCPRVVDVLSATAAALTRHGLSHREDDLLHGFCAAGTRHPRPAPAGPRVRPARGRYEVEFEVAEPSSTPPPSRWCTWTVTLGAATARPAALRRGSRVSVPAGAPRMLLLPDAAARRAARGAAGRRLGHRPGLRVQRELSAGRPVAARLPAGGRRLKIEARVVRLDPAPYGRYRPAARSPRSPTSIAGDRPAGRGGRGRGVGAGAPSGRLAAWAEARERRSIERRTSDRPA